MDKSKEYIKMCKKAKELNYAPSGTDGNWYYYSEEDIVKCRNSYEGDFGEIWLPRQDQLQKILEEELGLDIMIREFTKFSVDDTYVVMAASHLNATVLLTSMEQLWLAFIMKKRYNKSWNGDNWVNEK